MESISFREFLNSYSQNLENESIQLETKGAADREKGLRFNEYLRDHLGLPTGCFKS